MFDDLYPQQLSAATHGDGPLLVVAGAGTGKTTTLASRVGWLISERGVLAQRILLLTFSRRAAREMLARAHRITGHSETGRVWGGTFHAVANRLLRQHGRALGLPPNFTVLDRSDSADVLNLLRDELGFSTKERRFPRKDTLAAIHSRVVNSGHKLGDVLQRHYPWCIEEEDGIRDIFKAYVKRKREHDVLDLDDLLLFWKALTSSPQTGPQVAGLFDHVLVDEYQDTNALQADILEALRPPGTPRNLTVVGDDAQAIYGFRAATVRNILEFPQRFPGATVIKLEQNFRSTPPILDTSNAVIAHSPQRHEKTLWTAREGSLRPALKACLDEADQSDFVCRSVIERLEAGTPLMRQAVLFRAAHHSDLLEVELTRRNIPFVKYGGLKFLEAAHVKDALAMLRVLENPRDEVAWFRILQLPEGMGPATARRLMGNGIVNLVDHLVPRAAAESVRQLAATLEACRTLPLASQLDEIRSYLESVIARKYESPQARLADLDQLAILARGYDSRDRFLAELTLDPPSSTSDLAGPPLLDEDWLTLSTIHSAKGLEWDVVHVIHASDGHIPSDMSTGDPDEIEEERRLLYVALTRARDALVITYPQRYYRHHLGRDDRHGYALVSRFLEPLDVMETLDLQEPDVVDVRDEAGAVRGTASVDSYLAELFG